MFKVTTRGQVVCGAFGGSCYILYHFLFNFANTLTKHVSTYIVTYLVKVFVNSTIFHVKILAFPELL